MTIRQALTARTGRGVAVSIAEYREAEAQLIEFAGDMLRMLDSLAVVSFPLPDVVRISLDPEDDSAIYLTADTARRLRDALNTALEAS